MGLYGVSTMQKAQKPPARRSAVQLKTFITRLHEVGAKPAEVHLRPDGTLVAVFAKSDAAGLELESRMDAMMG